MLAIFKRDFRSLFHNVTGWLFCGLTLALFGLYFYVYNLNYGNPYISYSISGITFLFIITVPILTMRALAEERKAKTDQLLLTSPVSMAKVVLGKYLALAATFTICIAVICITPIVLGIFGDVPYLESYVTIFAFWLYGLSTIAIGLFASSITESQVVAAVVSFILVFLGYMMSSLLSIFSSSNVLATILGAYDLYTPLEEMMNGTFSLTGTLYYVSIIFLFLFFTYEVMQKRKWSISKSKITTSVFSGTTVIVVFAAVVLVNFLVAKIPTTYTEFDVTSQKIYSITDETYDYLETLEDDITIYVYVAESDKDDNVDKTLQHYANASDHITIEYIDPDNNPTFASTYTTDGSLTENSLVVVCGDSFKVINYGSTDYYMTDSDIYEVEYDYYSGSTSTTGYDCEGQVTAALQYVTSAVSTTVYELTGHDETALSDDYQEMFEKRFITSESLNLLTVDAIPTDCSALFIHAPQTDLSSDDLDKIEAYLNNGGQLYLSIEYNSWADLTNFQQLLADYGMSATGVVGEEDSSYYYQSPYYLLPYVESTDITTGITGNSSVFAPYAAAISYEETDDDATTVYTSFLTSSENSFIKSYKNITRDRTNDENTNSLYEPEDGDDTEGSYSLGVMRTDANGSKIVVVGSAYLFTDSANEIVSGRNATLFGGIVDQIVSTDSDVAVTAIASKDFTIDNITVSDRAITVYGVLWGIVIPLASIVVGIIIWARRRKL